MKRSYHSSEHDIDETISSSHDDYSQPGTVSRSKMTRHDKEAEIPRSFDCNELQPYSGILRTAKIPSQNSLQSQPILGHVPSCKVLFCINWTGHGTFRHVLERCEMNMPFIEAAAARLLLERGPDFLPKKEENDPTQVIEGQTISVAVTRILSAEGLYRDLSSLQGEEPEYLRIEANVTASVRQVRQPNEEDVGSWPWLYSRLHA